MKRLTKILDFVVHWSIILTPFSMAISNAPMNVFMGLFTGSFLIKKIINRERLFISTPLNLPFLFFIAASAISFHNSIDYHDSINGLFKLVRYMFLFLIIAEEIKSEKQVKKILSSIYIGISLTSIDAIWQLISGKDFIRGYPLIMNIGLRRATASFVDANVLGIYLSAIVPLIVGLSLYYFKSKKRIIAIFISLLGLVGLASTYSRPTLLALYLALLFLGIMKRDKILLYTLIILTVLSPFIAPRNVKDWAREVNYNPLIFMCNADRISIYRNSINMIKHHPIVGVGVNTFMKNYKTYKESPEYRNQVTSDTCYAHNNFLHTFAETGIIGLSMFIWLIFRLFGESFSIYKRLRNAFLKNVSLCLIACLIAFLVNGLTESSLYYSRVSAIFWYLAGLSLALNKFIHEENRTG